MIDRAFGVLAACPWVVGRDVRACPAAERVDFRALGLAGAVVAGFAIVSVVVVAVTLALGVAWARRRGAAPSWARSRGGRFWFAVVVVLGWVVGPYLAGLMVAAIRDVWDGAAWVVVPAAIVVAVGVGLGSVLVRYWPEGDLPDWLTGESASEAGGSEAEAVDLDPLVSRSSVAPRTSRFGDGGWSLRRREKGGEVR